MKRSSSALFGYAMLIVLLSAGAAQSLSGSNTVTTDDIVDHNITAADLGTNSVTRPALGDSAVGTAELANKSVTNAKLASTPPNGVQSIDSQVTIPASANGSNLSVALCPKGKTVIGGGGQPANSGTLTDRTSSPQYNFPFATTNGIEFREAWTVGFKNDTAQQQTAHVFAICAMP